jgi:hypothetical protein
VLRVLPVLPVLLFLFLATWAPLAQAQSAEHGTGSAHPRKLPTGVILVPGARSSASDTTTPVPEGGRVSAGRYTNAYFRLSYVLPPGWTQAYDGPPPSESGHYVLAQITPAETGARSPGGSILITAQDLFFSLTPAANALELLSDAKNRLQAGLEIEQPLALVGVAGHSFARFGYFSPVAQLHWVVFATQVRCHVIEVTFTGRDGALIESFVHALDGLKLPAEAGIAGGSGGNEAPVCIKDYAQGQSVIARLDPVFTERRFNPIPVRFVIDRTGKVRHVHLLSAFPEQARSITEALRQWRFSPYVRAGKPLEVETGMMFGFTPRTPPARAQ